MGRPDSLTFYTRQEAFRLWGLCDSPQLKAERFQGAKIAIRAGEEILTPRTGETLHQQLVARLGQTPDTVEYGFMIPQGFAGGNFCRNRQEPPDVNGN